MGPIFTPAKSIKFVQDLLLFRQRKISFQMLDQDFEDYNCNFRVGR